MKRTTFVRTGAIAFILGALLLLTFLLQLGASQASFERANVSSHVDVESVCQHQIEFGLALADAGELDPIHQAYYVDEAPAISVTIVVSTTGGGPETPIAEMVVALPRIPEPPLVISYSPGITPATYLYALTGLEATDPQYVSGTLPMNGNVVIAWDQALISGTEVLLGISPADPIDYPFEAATFPSTGTLVVKQCLTQTYLPIALVTGRNRPFTPVNPEPEDGEIEVSWRPNLTWQGGDPEHRPVSYTVSLEAGDPTPDALACDGVTATLCATGPLSAATQYYWQVTAENSKGGTAQGPVWTFTTADREAPVVPLNPTPADGAQNQKVNLTLTWDGTAPSYDVYLEEATLNPDELACEDVEEASCTVGPLEFGSDYSWKVVAHYPDGIHVESPVWRFYTKSSGWAIMVTEDFEGKFPDPDKWLVGDRNEHLGVYQWAKVDCRAFEGDYSGWGVGGGTDGEELDCGDNYPNHAESWMIHGPFSLAFALEAELTYQAWLNIDSDWDSICHYASTNGTNFSGSCSTLASPQRTWTERKLDLSNVNTLGDLRGKSKVWIAIKFESNETGTKPEGGYIDNLVLRKYADVGEAASAAPASAFPVLAGDRPATFDLDEIP